MIRAGSSSTTDSTLSNPSALERFYDYYIKENYGNPIPFGKREKTAVGLELLGSSAGIYYWPSAAAYGVDKSDWLKTSLIAGNTVVGVLFLVKATDDLFETILRESKSPEDLKDLVKLPTKKDLTIKYLKMGVGSAFCSIPFGIATYLFPLPGCNQIACLATIVTHSILSNIILHGISLNVILNPAEKIYRLPTLLFEEGYERYKKSKMTDSEKELLKHDENKEKIYQKYRIHFNQYFNSQALKIVNSHRKNPGGSPTTFLREIKNPSSSIITMAAVDMDEEKEASTQPPSRIQTYISAHPNIRKSVGFLGGTFMVLGCMGWVANPAYICLSVGLSEIATAFVSFLPTWSMGVLVAFYGENIFKQIFDYLTSWQGDKFPLEAKLYPISFTLFLFINAYLSIFSYGTAEILVNTIFGNEMWDAFRPVLQTLAFPAVPVLSFIPFLDLFTIFVRKSTAKFGRESDEKLYSRLLVKSAVMSQEILLIKGPDLIDSIQRFTSEQQKFLGINPEEFKADEEILSQLEQQISLQRSSSMEDELKITTKQYCSSCCKFPFWNSPREKESLLVNSSGTLESFTV